MRWQATSEAGSMVKSIPMKICRTMRTNRLTESTVHKEKPRRDIAAAKLYTILTAHHHYKVA